MASCCANYIMIKGEKTELSNLFDLLEEWTDNMVYPTSFGKNWLGNIVIRSGIGTVYENKETDIYCRGHVCEITFEDDEIYIQTESLNRPAIQMWNELCKKYLSEYNLIYSAEDYGNDIFLTNDDAYKDKYILRTASGEWIMDAEIDYVYDTIKTIYNVHIPNDELIKFYEDNKSKADIFVSKWNFCNLSNIS